MVPEPEAAALFLEFSRHKLLEQYWPRLRACVESLTDEQVWWRPNQASNSVGNLLLHLNGNVRQWLISSFNHEQCKRNRPAEFEEEEQAARSVLLSKLNETMQEAADILARLTDADLIASYDIQGYQSITGLAAVYQVVEHFGLHYGQVIYITKLLRGEDLGFYRELNATGRIPATSTDINRE
jgi:uncharacterized damage-inducible protein DinB